MRGQEHGRALGAVDLLQEFADALLGNHVQADGGLVKEEQRRIVQERGGQVAAHALAKRKLAHRGVQILADVQDFGEAAEAAPVIDV